MDGVTKQQKLAMLSVLAVVVLVAIIVPLVMLGGGEDSLVDTFNSDSKTITDELEGVKNNLGSMDDQLRIKIETNSTVDDGTGLNATETEAEPALRRRKRQAPTPPPVPAVVSVDPALAVAPSNVSGVMDNSSVVAAIAPINSTDNITLPGLVAEPSANLTVGNVSEIGLNPAIAPVSASVANISTINETSIAANDTSLPLNNSGISADNATIQSDANVAIATDNKEFLNIVDDIHAALDKLTNMNQNFTQDAENKKAVETQYNKKEVSVVEEELANLTTRLGLIEIKTVQDREIALNLLNRIRSAESEVDRTLTTIQQMPPVELQENPGVAAADLTQLQGIERTALDRLENLQVKMSNFSDKMTDMLQTSPSAANATLPQDADNATSQASNATEAIAAVEDLTLVQPNVTNSSSPTNSSSEPAVIQTLPGAAVVPPAPPAVAAAPPPAPAAGAAVPPAVPQAAAAAPAPSAPAALVDVIPNAERVMEEVPAIDTPSENSTIGSLNAPVNSSEAQPPAASVPADSNTTATIPFNTMSEEIKLYLNHTQNIANKVVLVQGEVDNDIIDQLEKVQEEMETAFSMIETAAVKDSVDSLAGDEVLSDTHNAATALEAAIAAVKDKHLDRR